MVSEMIGRAPSVWRDDNQRGERFTRLTNAFSKKFENHAHMFAIYAVWHNWLRIHKTLRVTPAMAAGLSQTVMDWAEIVEAMDVETPAKKRGPYKGTAKERA
jgi:hypothetical protein